MFKIFKNTSKKKLSLREALEYREELHTKIVEYEDTINKMNFEMQFAKDEEEYLQNILSKLSETENLYEKVGYLLLNANAKHRLNPIIKKRETLWRNKKRLEKLPNNITIMVKILGLPKKKIVSDLLKTLTRQIESLTRKQEKINNNNFIYI